MSGSKAKQYPPQTGAYAVKVKTGAGWQEFDTARLQLSAGQPYHEAEKLRATFNWVGQRFEKVIICANDTLQRFNHEMDGLTPSEAFSKAESDGREWIERNISSIRSLPNYTDFERFADLSKRYLLEETAVFSIMFKTEAAVDIYPGSTLLPCTIFQGQTVDGAPDGLGMGHFSRIDFKRNQKFSELQVA